MGFFQNPLRFIEKKVFGVTDRKDSKFVGGAGGNGPQVPVYSSTSPNGNTTATANGSGVTIGVNLKV